MANATPTEIELFLKDVRITLPVSFIPINNEKNKKTMSELHYNWDDVKEEIKSLSIEDYSEGPSNEIGTKNKIWIFGKIIQNQEIYIKIKLIGMNNKAEEIDTVYCRSFHFAEDSLHHPYKK